MFEPTELTGAELLTLAVDRLQAEQPSALPGPQALARVQQMLVLRERLQACVLGSVRDIDVRELYALDGAGSTRGWLRAQLTGDDGQLALTRSLAQHEQIDQAFAAGELAARVAGQLCTALDKVPADVDEDVLQAVLLDGVGRLLTTAAGGTPEDGLTAEQQAQRDADSRLLAQCCAATASTPAARLEPAFLLLAQRLTPNLLGMALRQLLDAVLPDGSDGQDDTDPYYLELRPLYDGDWDLRGLLDPATGQSLAAEIERRRAARAAQGQPGPGTADDVLALFQDVHGHDDGEHGAQSTAVQAAQLVEEAQPAAGAPDASSDPTRTDPTSTDPASDEPSADPAEDFVAALTDPRPDQPGTLPGAGRQRHDALAQLLADAHDSQAGTGQLPPAAITIVTGLDGLLGQPGALPGLLDHPGRPPVPLPPETLQRLGCHSELSAVLLDALGNPIGASSTRRSANQRERRALRARWGPTCAVRGCTSTSTVPHHAEPWWLSRITRLRDLVPLCQHCHHDLHEGHRTLRLRDGRWIDDHGWARPADRTADASAA